MESSTSTTFNIFAILFIAVIAVWYLVGVWKLYVKAGQPGWAALVPIYNIYVLLKMIGRPGWWLLLYIVPIANLIVPIIVAIDLGKSFGRSALFGVLGLWLAPMIGYVMLGFGKSAYKGPANQPPVPPMQPEPMQAQPAIPTA